MEKGNKTIIKAGPEKQELFIIFRQKTPTSILCRAKPEISGRWMSVGNSQDFPCYDIIRTNVLYKWGDTSIQTGDVITFTEENRLVTHRISDVISTDSGVHYTTKGDNNHAPDSNPVLAENIVAEYNGFTIPYVGYFLHFAQSPNGSILFMIIPGVLMLGYSLFTIWNTLRQVEEKHKSKTLDVK